jgi:hypothetical protein
MTSSPNENSTAVRQENTSVTVSADSSELLGTWALRQQGLRVKIKLGLLVGLLVLHVVISWIAIAPGYLLIDEACYHWMTRDFSATGGLALWNGYEEFPSIELSHRHLPIHAGRVVPTYPYLFPVICLPFYRLWGFYGLFVVNALAFVGVVLLCLASARRMFRDLNLAVNACFILIFTTFAWEYSQAAWPHTTSLLFMMAAFYLWVRAYYAETPMRAVVFAFFVGLVMGFAPGVRLESFLLFPCLVVPFLFTRPWRPHEAMMIGIGAFPGLAVLAATNYVKFGAFTPFTYGGGAGIPIVLPIIAATCLLVAWILTRAPYVRFLRRGKPLLILLVVVAVAGVFLAPGGREVLRKVGTNAAVSLLDVRALDDSVKLPSLDRTPGGGMIYIGAHKKSLLQSMPFLALLIVPLVCPGRQRKDTVNLAVLFLIPAVIIAYYAYFPHEYGGLCLNLRYFVSFLPFVAILCAYGIREMEAQWGRRLGSAAWVPVVVLTGALFWWLVWNPGTTLNYLELPVLGFPLILAAFLLFLLGAGFLVETEGSRPLRAAAWIVLWVAMAWSSFIAFFHDYPRHQQVRLGNSLLGERGLSHVAADSLFFSHPFLSPALLEVHRIRIAFPAMDRGKDMPRLINFHLAHGRRVFGAFSERFWTMLETQVLTSHTVQRMAHIGGGAFLGEIRLRSEPAAGRGSP